MPFCYINGGFREEGNASIPITNIGVQRGLGVFDLFRTRDGKPTFLEDYLERFQNSQKFLHFDNLISNDEVKEAIAELQHRNKFQNSTFKLVLLGEGVDNDPAFKPFFYILNTRIADELPLIEGAVITHEYLREFPLVKTLNYQMSYVLHQRKVAANAVDVIYYKNGLVSEASRSNVFVIKDGVLKTPESNILKGVTRKHLLKISESLLTMQVASIAKQELFEADEVFISSTYKQVMPIVQVDGHKIGSGKMGSETKKIRKAFLEYVA